MEAGGVRRAPKRVFINNVDTYASKNIAKFLSQYVVGAFGDPDGENEEEVEEEGTMSSLDDGARAFQVVGTVSEESNEDGPCVLEEYCQVSRGELLPKLMDCDVVIYDITQHTNQVEDAGWAVSVPSVPSISCILACVVMVTFRHCLPAALHNKMELFSKPKLFILISTVMTWARSKPVDPYDLELPFTDDIFWRRKAHPNFNKHINLEKRVVKMGKTNRRLFSTYVVASGLQYGMGEQTLHYFFKTSWLGQEEIPVFGSGLNIVPTIHINDLASVIQNVIRHQPQLYYVLAVDNSNNTLEDIVTRVATVLGTGKIQKRPYEEAFLVQEISGMACDSILVNLCMKGVLINELFSVSWLCESGLVDNIELVVEEYRQTRGLLPIRLCVLGPPAVGKTTVSKDICKHYRLHHISLTETISETIAKLKDTVKNFDPDAGNEDSAAEEAQELLKSIKECMEKNGGVLDDQLLVKLVRNKLMSNPCRNQGFALDGFPKTYEQAQELFADEYETDEGTTTVNKKIIPEFVLCLNASDAFLKDRVMNLPQRVVEEHNYEHGHFLKCLARFRENNVEDQTVVNYFDELNINPLCLEITSGDEPDYLLLMQKIFIMVGKPRNYGPSIQEIKEGDRRKAEEKMRREAQVKAQEEQREAEEAVQRAANWEEWTKGLEKARQQEEKLLEEQTEPMRNYLMDHVMPILTRGLMDCFIVQPEDPVDFLAEYLFKNNPGNY